ncbi:sodium/proline symporter PutP [Papillibacter cinnamivorans]|uniref:Sodium/proline symporter n=1 Tax=Papillibacter cinnamivorans DSM 12816 TaxID=1122930 RepID=A0A1W2BG06_9FIRM|nr:sodium/proline symporter PutP [Papillibacter cinnamivorans]SMC71905.1 sodium/proline symporter [Papillibacter cinnamivorans DSM 12816]
MGNSMLTLLSMVLYMIVMIVIGVFFAKFANEDSEHFFIGGRRLGPWVAAMSAEASDMSGWLLMGLPGVAYWCGLADAAWTAIGLAIGTYLNWLLVSKRLRRYSIAAGNAITIPEFFSNRFKENRKVIMTIAALFILIFFAVYTGSCFVTCGKLFNQLFGLNYQMMMLIGAAFVLTYTFLGGFLAESTTDFVQGIVMIFALIAVLASGTAAAGGLGAVVENARSMPGFLEFFGIASPSVDASGVQQLSASGAPLFGAAGAYGPLTIVSTMAWGLGYFGMPQVLLRFMGIRSTRELTKSRRIAMIWVLISLAAAVCIGIVGRALFPSALLTSAASEDIFIVISSSLMHPLVAGVMMAGILAATMSSSDSYLLIAASAFARNIYQGVIKKNAGDKEIMTVSRITLLLVAVIGIVIALDENSIIFKVVSFAWAGFGATFGPIMLFSLFWKRTNRAGAIAGMLGGGGMVFLWKLVIRPMGGVFGIYELLPAFIFSCIMIVVVSLLTEKPSREIEEEFEAVRAMRD